MKSIVLITQSKDKSRTLEQLRSLGVMHVESPLPSSGQSIERLSELREKAHSMLGLCGPDRKQQNPGFPSEIRLQRVLNLRTQIPKLEAEIKRQLAEWQKNAWTGAVGPQDFQHLKKNGIDLRVLEISQKTYRKWAASRPHSVLGKTAGAVRVAVWNRGGENFSFRELAVGSRSALEMNYELEKSRKRLFRIRTALQPYLVKGLWKNYIARLEEKLDFERTSQSFAKSGPLVFCRGYCPARDVPGLKKAAACNGWALLVRDPLPDENPPSLIERSAWLTPVEPLFKLIGAVPNYRETDVGFLFLLFFCLFFAILVGDAGYGAILLASSLLWRKKITGHFGNATQRLMILLSSSTLVWGGLSGNWFGSEVLSRTLPFRLFVLQEIYAFDASVQPGLIGLCFAVAALHLSLAHALVFFKARSISQKISQTGWLLLIWCIYLLARDQVLGSGLPGFFPGMLAGGGLLAFPFGLLDTSAGKGLGEKVLADGFLKLVGSFADSMSYLRLFAVGLATLAIARSFNSIAFNFGFDTLGGALAAGFILLLGHGTNLLLAGMSVIVHGLRLNILEFSSHVGNTWSGHAYRPFAKGTL